VLVEVHAAAVNPLDVANIWVPSWHAAAGVDFAAIVVSDGDLNGQEFWGSAPQLGMKRSGTHARSWPFLRRGCPASLCASP
jgi:NADPH:quinone reductase